MFWSALKCPRALLLEYLAPYWWHLGPCRSSVSGSMAGGSGSLQVGLWGVQDSPPPKPLCFLVYKDVRRVHQELLPLWPLPYCFYCDGLKLWAKINLSFIKLFLSMGSKWHESQLRSKFVPAIHSHSQSCSCIDILPSSSKISSLWKGPNWLMYSLNLGWYIWGV